MGNHDPPPCQSAAAQKNETPIVADPQADTAARLIRWFTAGLASITPEDVAMARVGGMALLPQIGGLVMMLAMALPCPDQVASRRPLTKGERHHGCFTQSKTREICDGYRHR